MCSVGRGFGFGIQQGFPPLRRNDSSVFGMSHRAFHHIAVDANFLSRRLDCSWGMLGRWRGRELGGQRRAIPICGLRAPRSGGSVPGCLIGPSHISAVVSWLSPLRRLFGRWRCRSRWRRWSSGLLGPVGASRRDLSELLEPLTPLEPEQVALLQRRVLASKPPRSSTPVLGPPELGSLALLLKPPLLPPLGTGRPSQCVPSSPPVEPEPLTPLEQQSPVSKPLRSLAASQWDPLGLPEPPEQRAPAPKSLVPPASLKPGLLAPLSQWMLVSKPSMPSPLRPEPLTPLYRWALSLGSPSPALRLLEPESPTALG